LARQHGGAKLQGVSAFAVAQFETSPKLEQDRRMVINTLRAPRLGESFFVQRE
jgi:hypothetical protein